MTFEALSGRPPASSGPVVTVTGAKRRPTLSHRLGRTYAYVRELSNREAQHPGL
jgi:hypothetical protein